MNPDNQYCTCSRCPCCGKVLSPQFQQFQQVHYYPYHYQQPYWQQYQVYCGSQSNSASLGQVVPPVFTSGYMQNSSNSDSEKK